MMNKPDPATPGPAAPLSEEALRRYADMAGGGDSIVPVVARKALRALLAEVSRLESENNRLRTAYSRDDDEITQALGRALGYPRFLDDPKNFPGATDADGVCVGDHVGATLATEAAEWIRQLTDEVARLKAGRDQLRDVDATRSPRELVLALAGDSRWLVPMGAEGERMLAEFQFDQPFQLHSTSWRSLVKWAIKAKVAISIRSDLPPLK